MKLQDKLANSVRQIKTQQKEPKKTKAAATTRATTPEVTLPPLPSKRTWPD